MRVQRIFVLNSGLKPYLEANSLLAKNKMSARQKMMRGVEKDAICLSSSISER